MNPAKRRRLDATASTCAKPFRSPLKVTAGHQTAIPNAKKDYADHQATPPCKIQPATAVPTNPITSSLPENHVEEQDITELQKEYAVLGQHLRKLRQDLDAVEQAHRIQSTGQEEKLNGLISKWRNIARDAADEVFESASSRVKDMGGLQVWQKNAICHSSQGRLSDWYDNKEEQPSSDGVDGFEEDIEDGHTQDASVLVRERSIEEEKEEQSFTMDVMLQQLNIDPDLLGFDAKIEQWSN